MNHVEKLFMVLLTSLLIACSGADPDAQLIENKQTLQSEGNVPNKDFLFHEMKQSLDDAKAVQTLMDEKHAEQLKALENN